jgi:DNA gyrase subunit A
MRIYIELKRGVMGQIVLNQLFTMTPMQSSFGIINLAIVGGQPQVLTLKEILVQFINHRRNVVTRRCRYELRKAQDRAHVLEGYLLALANIDEVVDLVKASPTPADARVALRARFELTEVQAQSILDMRLQRLTGLEVDKINAEYLELQEEIKRLTAILADDELLKGVIITELERVRELYGDERRTQIIDATGSIGMEDLIADEDMVVTVTTTGYIKRTPLSEYRTQKRGGRGRSGMNTKTEDEVTNLFVASAHTLLMIFTDRGQVYPLKVWELPMGGINAGGKAIVNLIPLEKEEAIRSIVPVDDLDVTDQWLVFSTRMGVIKRTVLGHFKNVRNSGIRAINLQEGDDLIQVKLATIEDKIMLVSAYGQSIIFNLDQARAMGRATRGVRGIRLRAGDEVVAMDTVRLEGLPDPEEGLEEADGLDLEGETDEPIEEAEEILLEDEAELEEEEEGIDEEEGETEEVDENESSVVLVTVKGYGKRCRLSNFRVQKRGGLGLRALPRTERNGLLVSMCQVRQADDLMVVTDGGTIIRMPVRDVRSYSRYAKGVRVISVPKGDVVVGIFTVVARDEDDDELLENEEEGRAAETVDGAIASDETAQDTFASESDEATETPQDEPATEE